MPAPHGPEDFEALIPSVTGSFCQRFLRVFQLPRRIHEQIKYIWTDSGEFTDEFKLDICNLECTGGGPGGPPTDGDILQPPTAVMATDGDFSDKVRVTWPGVSGATSYLVYRNTVNTSASATFLGEVTSTTYDDASATPGTTYYYWVKAKNATQTSVFSDSDPGYIALPLPAITNLAASQGLDSGFGELNIRLVFSPITGAEAYDFYRSTTDDFSTAQRIDEDRAPFDNSDTQNLCPVIPCSQYIFVDNAGELVYWHQIPSGSQYTRYYYWVRGKKLTQPAISPPSNSAAGWSVGFGDGVPPRIVEQLGSGFETTVQLGDTQAWLALAGGGAGGAGGSTTRGGGGAGAGATIWGLMTVVPGAKFRVRSNPVGGLIGGHASDGDPGYQTFLEYSADGNPANYVAVMTANSAGGGLFNPAGGGAGGAGGTGSTSGAITSPVIKAGRAGTAASGATGGRGGNRFGGTRLPSARAAVRGGDGHGHYSLTGSGSDADSLNLAHGGDPALGYAVLAFRPTPV